MKIKVISFTILLILLTSCSLSNKESENQNEKIEESIENNTTWEIIDKKDEWGDLTGEKSAMGVFKGTFSNSTTTDGSMVVAMFVNTQKLGGQIVEERLDTIVGFAFGEYDGRNSVKGIDLRGKARNSDGEIKEFSMYIGNNGLSMIISEINTEIFQFLCKGGNIDVILEEESEYGVPSKYKFTIPSYLNINDAVAQIAKKPN